MMSETYCTLLARYQNQVVLITQASSVWVLNSQKDWYVADIVAKHFAAISGIFRIPRKGPGKRGHIVADTNVSPFARARNICCGHKFCVLDTKNVSDFVQKHFASAANVSQFAHPKKHHEQQCFRNNVSSFPRALTKKMTTGTFTYNA